MLNVVYFTATGRPLAADSETLNTASLAPWDWLRSHQLSNRVYADYDELLRETDRAWLTLNEPILKSVCACPWIERAIQS